jgi:hypothetical protein
MRRWDKVDEDFLKEHYKTKSILELAKAINKPVDAVRVKLVRLKLRKGANKVWTVEEDEKLKEMFHSSSPKELEAVFGRSNVAILQRAHKFGLRREYKWSEEELDLLRANYAIKNWDELELLLGRSKKAILHAIRNYNLGVYKRKKWSDEEKELIKKNPNLTASQLQELIGDRSVCAIDQLGRKLKGSSKRTLRIGWDSPSIELAYVLGVLCSDAHVSSAGITLTISPTDSLFADEFARCAQIVFGLVPKKSIKVGSWQYKGDKLFGEYYSVGVYSVNLLPSLATPEGVAKNNLRGVSGEWVDFLNYNFAWVWDDRFFWHFMGGLYDGDGSLRESGISIGILPPNSREKIVQELFRRNIVCREDRWSIYCDDLFLEHVKCALPRKRRNQIIELPKYVNGVVRISLTDAIQFLETFHYLKTLPGGCVVYGYIQNQKLVGVAAFSSCVVEKQLDGLELQRFALADWTSLPASQILAAMLKQCGKDNTSIDFIRTFADPLQNHVGTIYQATGAIYLGQTTPQQVYVSPTGKEYSGRFHDRKMLADGVLPRHCTVKFVPGKHKYVYAWSEDAKQFFQPFALEYPKKLVFKA